jgi:phage virion morphogenesis protein
MSIQVRDTLSPALARKAAALRDKKPVLEAMGTQFVSISKRAFTDEALRPAPWAPLKPATIARKKGRGGILRDRGAMWQSIRITALTNDSVTAGSDRVQAAIHQFGGQTGRNHAATIPARPFFPILNGKLAAEAMRKIANVAKLKILSLLK